ncbi:MAG: hypothetical protein AAF443_07450, partial [Chlamydiota bacterium]
IQNAKRSVIWRGYFDRLFSWVLIRQVDKTQGKIGQKGPPNSARFLHFESARVYTPTRGELELKIFCQ